MRRILSLLILSLAVMLGLSLTVVANDATLYLGNPTSTITNGEYTSPYNGTINGTPTLLVCDDLQNNIYFDSSEQVTIVSTTNPGGTRYPGPYNNPTLPGLTETQAFNLVSYFASQIFANPSGGGNDGVDSWAIWSILDDGWANNQNPSDGASAYYLNTVNPVIQAAISAGYQNTNNGSYPLYLVQSYNGGNGFTGQEFIGNTPEPLSMALMGTFLTLAGLGLGKKKLFA